MPCTNKFFIIREFTNRLSAVYPDSVSSPHTRSTSTFKSTTLSQLSSYRLRKHADIRGKLAIETKLNYKTPEESVLESFRSPIRPSYSRGHEIHEPGSPIPLRPIGTSPILCRQSSNQRMDFATSPIKPFSRERVPETFIRLTTPNILASGRVTSGELGFVKGRMKYPLHTIACKKSSALACDVKNADLPPDADFILSESKMASIATLTRKVGYILDVLYQVLLNYELITCFNIQHLLDNTPLEDKMFVSTHRALPKCKGGGLIPKRISVAAEPLYKIDYSMNGSPDRKPRSICKQSFV